MQHHYSCICIFLKIFRFKNSDRTLNVFVKNPDDSKCGRKLYRANYEGTADTIISAIKRRYTSHANLLDGFL